MNIKRWLPFLLLLSILGGGVYWLTMDKGEEPEPDPEIKFSDEMAQIINAIDSVELNPSNVFGDVKALLDSVEASNLELIQKNQLTEKLGKKAVELFDQRFNAWVGSGFGSAPPEAEYTELRHMVGQFDFEPLFLSELQREFPRYAKAIVLYKLYFQSGAPDELITRLNRMRKRVYNPQRYQDLLITFNSHTNLLDGLDPVRRARNQIERQRQCHELVDDHLRDLKDASTISTYYYGKHELPPSVNVQTNFTCGARTYSIVDFDYYFKQGRDLNFWRQAIW